MTATLLYCMSSYITLVSLTTFNQPKEQCMHEGMVGWGQFSV
jgi:hypothetical protein